MTGCEVVGKDERKGHLKGPYAAEVNTSMYGTRVTDAVDFYSRRYEFCRAVRVVRGRPPEWLRWRRAISKVAWVAGELRGIDRMRVEEPVREVVVDLADRPLQWEVVVDARRHRVDFDRGEILPVRLMGDIRRLGFLAGIDTDLIRRYTALPEDFHAPVDTAAIVVIGRAFSNAHLRRARELESMGQKMIEERAIGRHMDLGRRWTAFAKAFLGAPQVS